MADAIFCKKSHFWPQNRIHDRRLPKERFFKALFPKFGELLSFEHFQDGGLFTNIYIYIYTATTTTLPPERLLRLSINRSRLCGKKM